MKNTGRKEKRSSLIHQQIRKAAFVQYGEDKNENNKYKYVHKTFLRLKKTFANAKRWLNSRIQKTNLWVGLIDWKKVREESSQWIVEAFLEGITLNFATHWLFGVPFNPATIFAHGILVKQGLDIYWRLRRDGSAPKIPNKRTTS